jgi:hypothetical protein
MMYLLSFFLESDPRLVFGQQRRKGSLFPFVEKKNLSKTNFALFLMPLALFSNSVHLLAVTL